MSVNKLERLVVMNSYTRDYPGSLAGQPGGLPTSTAAKGLGADANDEARMEQIRELLHGEMKRHHEARIAALELRIRELETGIFNQLDAMQARLDTLSSEMMNVRREHLDELARGFVDMGERVRRLTTRE